MGFSSWDCKGCGHPLLCEHAVSPTRINAWMTRVRLVTSDGRTVAGEYNGYARVVDEDGREHVAYDETVSCLDIVPPEAWHADCWEAAGKISDGTPSEWSECQGWFFDEGAHDLRSPMENS